MLLVAFCLNLAYEPFIVSPFVLSRLHGMTLAQAMSPGYAVFWSIIVAAAPVVLVGGVVLAISFQKERRTKTEPKQEKAEQPEQDEPVRESELYQYVCSEPGCGFRTNNPKQWAGHHNAHRTKGE